MKRWIKWPGPGQMRGDGDWIEFDGSEEDWEWFSTHDYVPIHVGDKAPEGEEKSV